MDAPTSSRRLLAWGLGSFHASVLVVVLVAVAYQRGGLGGALQGLSTATGFLLFGGLWLATTWTTGRALGGEPWPPPASRLLPRGVGWGAVNGLLFLLVLAGVTAAGFAVDRGPAALEPALVGLVVVGPIAAVVALVLGAAIGLLFACVDSLALALAARLADAGADWGGRADPRGGRCPAVFRPRDRLARSPDPGTGRA